MLNGLNFEMKCAKWINDIKFKSIIITATYVFLDENRESKKNVFLQ